MKSGVLLASLITIVSLFFLASASNLSSTNYNLNSVSDASNTSSSNYNLGLTIENTASNASSSNYKAYIGSLYGTETPTPSPTPSPTQETSGGGGGASTPVTPPAQQENQVVEQIENLEIKQDSFNLKIEEEKFSNKELTLKNNGEKEIEVKIELKNLEGIVTLLNSTVTILPNGEVSLPIDIHAPKTPGIYTGIILLVSESKVIEIPFTLNVKSQKSLFDINVFIPDSHKTLKSGQKLAAQITLIQAAKQDQVDVTLNYLIKDFDGKIHFKESETIAVYKQKTFSKEFQTSILTNGKYILGAEVIYKDGIATASSQFNIGNKQEFALNISALFLLSVLIIVIAASVLILLLIKRYKKELKLYKNKAKKR